MKAVPVGILHSYATEPALFSIISLHKMCKNQMTKQHVVCRCTTYRTSQTKICSFLPPSVGSSLV